MRRDSILNGFLISFKHHFKAKQSTADLTRILNGYADANSTTTSRVESLIKTFCKPKPDANLTKNSWVKQEEYRTRY